MTVVSHTRIQYIQSDENYVLWYLNGQSGDRQVIEADFAVFTLYDNTNTPLAVNGKWYQENVVKDSETYQEFKRFRNKYFTLFRNNYILSI